MKQSFLADQTLESLVRGLATCVRQFDQENGPSPVERAVQIAFANSLFLSAESSGEAASLLAEIGNGVNAEEAVAAFRDFAFEGDWMAAAGEILDRVQADEDAERRVEFALIAGLLVAARQRDLAATMSECARKLNSETRFLTSRLTCWRLTGWRPEYAPFVEFTAGFYGTGTKERKMIAGSVREVLAISIAMSDPWSLRLWAETGWYGGRKLATDMPELRDEIFAEVSRDMLAAQVRLYRTCILTTTSSDGTVRPEQAALRYFGLMEKFGYAGTFCRGDQPRYIARLAYDLMFWMGMVSTKLIPADRC